MPTAISMPKLGMTMEEGTVVEWPLSLGDPVAKGQTVLIIESEKSEVEIEASGSGFFRHIFVEEGETVACGTLLAVITETRDEPFDADAFHSSEQPPTAAPRETSLRVEAAAAVGSAEPRQKAPGNRRPVAPAARATAKKLGIDAEAVAGTGPGGRVTKRDVEEYAAARAGRVSVAPGVALDVLVSGEGDPVVLLPGLGTDVSAFTRQTSGLEERFRVHGVNPRGVGLSDAPEAEVYEVRQTAADAAAVFAGAAHVIGASLGAAAAIEMALDHPERVQTLTLITPFVEAAPRLVALCEAWRRIAAEATPETLAAALLPWFFSSDFLADEVVRGRTRRGLAQAVARVPAGTLDRMTAGLVRWSGTRGGDLSKIAVPTLVIAGGEDLLVQGAEAIAGAIPTATFLVVEGAGHAVALEAPDAVNDALAAHLVGFARP